MLTQSILYQRRERERMCIKKPLTSAAVRIFDKTLNTSEEVYSEKDGEERCVINQETYQNILLLLLWLHEGFSYPHYVLCSVNYKQQNNFK